MRVLQVTHQYPPHFIGGVELYTQSLCKHLGEVGVETAVFTRHPSANNLTPPTPPNITFQAGIGPISDGKRYLNTLGQPALQQQFTETLDHFAPDLVHIQHLMGLPAQLIKLLKKRNIPYIVSLHDYWWRCANANLFTNYDEQICAGPKRFLNCTRCIVARGGSNMIWLTAPALLATLLKRNQHLIRILTNAKTILAPSQFVKNWYEEQGIRHNDFQVLPLGIDQLDKPISQHTARPYRFLYLGGISKTKGIHLAIQAFQAIETSSELWIAGNLNSDPHYAQQLRELSADNDLIHFLGSIAREDLGGLLAQCDSIVIPSVWHETYNFVAREALAFGKSVIASDVGALSSLPTLSKNIRLVEANNVDQLTQAMQEIINKPCISENLSLMTPAAHAEHIATIYSQAFE